MNDDVRRLEQRVQELADRLRRVEERVFQQPESAPAGAAESEIPPPATKPARAATGFSATGIMSLIGRSMIVLGGAFLIRWLTQSGVLPQELGSIIGMVYAILWIVLADVKAGRGQRLSACFHGVTGAMIALPLLTEATSKFHFLSPAEGSISLVAFVILGLLVAGRRRLRVLAWIVAVPAAPIALILAGQTGAMAPFLLNLLVLGLFTLWLGYLRHWTGLATVMAAAVNLGMLMLILDHAKNVEQTGVLEMKLWEPLALLIGLIVIYFGSYSFRVFSHKRTITELEIGQTLAVVFIGLGGIAVVVNARHISMLPVGILCIVLAAACYGAAYGFLPRLDPNRRNFVFYTLLGLASYLLGCELIFGKSVAGIVFAVTALLTGAIAKPVRSPVLYLHGSLYSLAAIVGSGMMAAMIKGFIGPIFPTAPWATLPVIAALAATLAYPWFPRPDGRFSDVFLGRRSVELLTVIAVLGAGLGIIALLSRWLPPPEEHGYRGAVAAARTVVLAVASIVLAWISRRARYHYMAWPVYTLLALCALKIVMEDVKTGGSSIMFVAFAVYGGALILAPRLLRSAGGRRSRSTSGTASGTASPDAEGPPSAAIAPPQ